MNTIIIYWKYRGGNKLLSLSPSSSWYLTCEPDTRGNYMLILFADRFKMVVDDGYMYSITGPEMDDGDLRELYNNIIDNASGIAAESPKILNLDEIRISLLRERYPDWSPDDEEPDDGDDDEDYTGSDYDFDEEYY